MTRQQRRYAERQAAKDAKRKPQKFRRGSASDYTAFEIYLAQGYLMTGERAQKPSWAAVRKGIRMLRHYVDLGLPVPPRHVQGGWRHWPKKQGEGLEAING